MKEFFFHVSNYLSQLAEALRPSLSVLNLVFQVLLEVFYRKIRVIQLVQVPIFVNTTHVELGDLWPILAQTYLKIKGNSLCVWLIS